MRGRHGRGRKGVSVGFLVVAGLAVMLILTLMLAGAANELSLSAAQGIYNQYFVTKLDKMTQGFKQVLEKQALWYAAMDTAIQLSDKGGLGQDAIAASDDTPASAIQPKIVISAAPESLPYWTVFKDLTWENRIPYNRWRGDPSYIYAGNPAVALIRMEGEPAPREVTAQILILKKGASVTTSCTPSGKCTLTPAAGTPTPITQDGVYTYNVQLTDPLPDEVFVRFSSAQGTAGEPAAVRLQAIASVYKGGAEIPNRLLEKNLNVWKNEYVKAFNGLGFSGFDSGVGTLKAIFSSIGSFVYTQAWPETLFVAPSVTETGIAVVGFKPLAKVYGSAWAENVTRIRYWELYGKAKAITETFNSEIFKYTTINWTERVKKKVVDHIEYWGEDKDYENQKKTVLSCGELFNSFSGTGDSGLQKIFDDINKNGTKLASELVTKFAEPDEKIDVSIQFINVKPPAGWSKFWRVPKADLAAEVWNSDWTTKVYEVYDGVKETGEQWGGSSSSPDTTKRRIYGCDGCKTCASPKHYNNNDCGWYKCGQSGTKSSYECGDPSTAPTGYNYDNQGPSPKDNDPNTFNNKAGRAAYWHEWYANCNYEFGVEYEIRITITDNKYKVLKDGKWESLSLQVRSKWGHYDNEISLTKDPAKTAAQCSPQTYADVSTLLVDSPPASTGRYVQCDTTAANDKKIDPAGYVSPTYTIVSSCDVCQYVGSATSGSLVDTKKDNTKINKQNCWEKYVSYANRDCKALNYECQSQTTTCTGTNCPVTTVTCEGGDTSSCHNKFFNSNLCKEDSGTVYGGSWSISCSSITKTCNGGRAFKCDSNTYYGLTKVTCDTVGDWGGLSKHCETIKCNEVWVSKCKCTGAWVGTDCPATITC